MLSWTRLSAFPCSVPPAISRPVRLALETLALVLRNAALCNGVGWLFGYCFTVGNFFSGLPPAQQSYADFSAANIAWFYGIFSLCMVVLMAMKLLPEHFVGCVGNRKVAIAGAASSATRRLNILQCTLKLLGRMAPHLVLSSIIVVGGDFTMYSFVSESWHQFKPCVYIAAFWGFYILVIADVFVRHIFRTETVRGLIASDFKLPENLSRTILIQQQRRHRRFWMPSRRQFVKVYARNLPVMFFSMIAIVYVHAISQFVVLQGQWELFAFASASVALKLCLQELAKKMMIATRKPVSRRAMVTLVATPTILVDTQVRMVLLRQASTNVSVVGTVVLAIFEVLVRAFKSLAVQRQTRGPPTPRDISRRWSTFAKSPPARASTSSTTPLDVMAKPRTASSTLVRTGTALRSRVHSKGETVAQCNARREAEERRQKYRVLHAAEIYSDMYAEYIAIGCSYAILFFYHDHAHFQFSLSALQNRQFGYLGALQMGVEVVVDFLACVVEAAEGVEFKSFDQNDPFLVFLLAVLTFSNVAISAGLYIR